MSSHQQLRQPLGTVKPHRHRLPGPLVFFLLIFSIFSCHQKTPVDGALSLVPEFEEQESTFICWNPKFQQVILPLVTEIARTDQVTLFYNENYHQKSAIQQQLVQYRANLRNIDLHPFRLDQENVWIRDYGPSFLHTQEGALAVAGFEYPHLNYVDYGNFAPQYSQKMKLPFLKSALYSTGGGREINGKGTILLVEGYEKLVNPGLTKQEIEQEYGKKFGLTHFIWLKRGIPQDDLISNGPILENIYGFGVQGHIDEFCRFADARTILLTEIDSADRLRDPIYQVIHERLQENYRILSQAVDQDGQPFRIIRVPQAPVIFANGKLDTTDIFYTPVTSYLNFVITNRAVFMPQYDVDDSPDWVRQKDEHARQALQQAFKNREIKMIDAIDLNYQGGGLHCITLSQPKVRKQRFYPFRWRRDILG